MSCPASPLCCGRIGNPAQCCVQGVRPLESCPQTVMQIPACNAVPQTVFVQYTPPPPPPEIKGVPVCRPCICPCEECDSGDKCHKNPFEYCQPQGCPYGYKPCRINLRPTLSPFTPMCATIDPCAKPRRQYKASIL